MSEYDDESDLEEVDESEVIKKLRKDAAKAGAAEAEAQTLRTENALLKAGLGGLTEKQRKAFLAAHDGELDAEALKATALELGFAKADEQPQQQIPADEQAQHQRLAEATAGAVPSEAQVKSVNDEISVTQSPEELRALIHQHGGRTSLE